MKNAAHVIATLLLASFQVACGRAEFDGQMRTLPTDAPHVDVSRSTFKVVGPHLADGLSESWADFTMRDQFGKPIAGLNLELHVGGDGNVVKPCTQTNASGVGSCRFRSSNPGEKNVALVGAVEMNDVVTFAAPKSLGVLFGFVASADDQTLPSGHRIVSASGIVEGPIRVADNNQYKALTSSHLSTIFPQEELQ